MGAELRKYKIVREKMCLCSQAGSSRGVFKPPPRLSTRRAPPRARLCGEPSAANLATNIMDFRGFDSSNLNSKGWNSQTRREFSGKFESSNLSRDNVIREIGSTARVCGRKNTPPEKKTLGSLSLRNTESGSGEELFLSLLFLFVCRGKPNNDTRESDDELKFQNQSFAPAYRVYAGEEFVLPAYAASVRPEEVSFSQTAVSYIYIYIYTYIHICIYINVCIIYVVYIYINI